MRKIWIIIVIAIVVRVVLMPISYHSDVAPFDLAGYLFKQGVGLNFYDYLPNQAENSKILSVFPANLFNYPPMVYFFLGGVDNIVAFLTPVEVREKFLFDVSKSFGDVRVNLHLFYLKLVYIPFDIGIGWLLWKLTEKKFRLMVLGFWVFNPVVIFGVYLMGQFDVIPAFFTILALYLVREKLSNRNLLIGAFCLGLGAAFKIYPLLLLPVLGSVSGSWVKRIIVILIGLGAYVLTISPFLFSSGFRSTALVAGQTMKSLYAQVPLSGGESVMLYITALVFVYLFFWTNICNPKELGSRMMIALLIFFMFTHFHPQWFLWVVPFLILDLANNGFKNFIGNIVIYGSWFGSLWLFDSGMTIGLFSPVWPSLYNGQSIWQLVGYPVDINFARSILASTFFGGSIYIIFYSLKTNNLRSNLK